MQENHTNTDALQHMKAVFQAQRKAHSEDSYPGVDVRIDRINRVINLLVDNQYGLCEAIEADFGKRNVEVSRMQEFMSSVSTLKYARKHVRKWMRPIKRSSNPPFSLMGAKAYVQHQPLGVVGNMSPWNFPIALTVSPLGGIFAAGNRAMLKPSEFTPNTSSLMADLIAAAFDVSELAVIQGGANVAAAFSAMPFDHLLFTGSTNVGSKILAATAPNLVPTTLELGGKSPVIIAEDADIVDAAKKVAFAKINNMGQICIAPDYILLTAQHKQVFIDAYCDALRELFPDGIESEFFCNIINEAHSLRLTSLIDDATATGNSVINVFDEVTAKPNPRCIPPVLIDVSNSDCRVMREEIFGPLLPIVEVSDTDAAIEYVRTRAKPLALYLFSNDSAVIQKITQEVACGGQVVNELLVHFLQDDLPFGGVGPSGMGVYHGPEGFKTFSHAKSVFCAPKMSMGKLLHPPYGKLFRWMLDHEISK